MSENLQTTPADGWLEQLFDAIDEMDTERFMEFLAEDAVFRFGSAEPARGSQAIREAVAGFFSSIAGCSHTLRRTWPDHDSLVCEGEVVYRRHDDSSVTIPFANVFRMQNGLIRRYSIYTDLAPLFDA